jgi:stage V sporulation protein G
VDITEVRIKLMEDPHDRLQAFCSITFDHAFVVRDLKIIQGTKGSFVAMPSRKLTDRCPRCHSKNHLRAQNCNQCGARLNEERASKDGDGHAKLYADIAHPINSDCRDLIQHRVLEAFDNELVMSNQPEYRCTYDNYGEDQYATLNETEGERQNIETFSDKEGDKHRIEPAAQQPVAPHHAEGSPTKEMNRNSSAATTDVANKNDSFGDGII